MKILFAASEAFPLIKTGGLGDVAGALPVALRQLRHDVRLILPAYPAAKEMLPAARPVAELAVEGVAEKVTLLQGKFPHASLPVYLVDAPGLFGRTGNPYTAPGGDGWPDNPHRFAAFGRVIAAVALNLAQLEWQPDVVHCNDWQCGLAPVLLSAHAERPKSVFTIHNLAYQGLFDRRTFDELRLPESLWHWDALEFHGNFSFIKGGIAFADAVTTVSPTYAREICHNQMGYGLEGLLRSRADRLYGILNGVDYRAWNPQDDPHLVAHYGRERLAGKGRNKAALQEEFGLPVEAETPLLVHVGRLVEQKGADLILHALEGMPAEVRYQLILIGSGETWLERALKSFAREHPDSVAVRIGYDEALAHRLEAGGDIFLMPSRFEPCGLNQIYSLKYGTVPVVHRVGGLADTVIDAIEHTLRGHIATGFVFDYPDAFDLRITILRALELYRDRKAWRDLMRTGMAQDFSWTMSARQYARLYRQLVRPAS
ncbi:MAG: glycogen synthase GlgA [Gammaproteobacteria bacterium]